MVAKLHFLFKDLLISLHYVNWGHDVGFYFHDEMKYIFTNDQCLYDSDKYWLIYKVKDPGQHVEICSGRLNSISHLLDVLTIDNVHIHIH